MLHAWVGSSFGGKLILPQLLVAALLGGLAFQSTVNIASIK